MTHRSPEEIRAKFADLNRYCDPRGHELLQELERLCLRDNSMLALHDRIAEIQNELSGGGDPVPDNLIPFPGYSVRV